MRPEMLQMQLPQQNFGAQQIPDSAMLMNQNIMPQAASLQQFEQPQQPIPEPTIDSVKLQQEQEAQLQKCH